jgi:deoxyadenosine/deoxycytidine kinase
MNFLVIEGNIGAGKTSLAQKISEEYNAKMILEQFAENPFLPKFYKEPEKYSFQLELSFLVDRFQQLKTELSEHDLFKTFFVTDYFFSKSLIFAANTLADDEFKLYRKIFNTIYTSLPKPDLYVYLYVTPEKSIENIKKRGRNYEQEIEIDYLEKIQNAYFEYFKQYQNEYKFLIIDTNNIDFVNNPEDYKKIKDVILNQNHSKGINRIIL